MIRRILNGLLFIVVVTAIIGSVFVAQFIWFKPPSLTFFHERVFLEFVLDDPELLSMLRLIEPLGLHFHNNDLTDPSDERAQRLLKKAKDDLATLRSYDRAEMNESQQLSTDILDWFLDDNVRAEPFMYHNYPVNQLFGVQSELPTFMATMHQINNKRDANHYIERLEKFPWKFERVLTGLKERESRGIIPPKFIIERVLDEMSKFVEEGVESNILYTTMFDRLNEKDSAGAYVVDISASNRQALCEQTHAAIENVVFPAYRNLIDYFTDLEGRATEDDGFWRLPEGDAAYAYFLRHSTTTGLTPDEVHRIGIAEVYRILSAMRAILDEIGRNGLTVGEQMRALAADPEQLFPNTDEGRQACLTGYQQIIDEANANLDEAFDLRPDIGVRVERIPEFKEATSAGAYYNPPALDGSRPGIFYAKLIDMKEVPKYSMKTLAYHEAVPGHHFQLALQQEIEGVPTFRKVVPFTAYAEGWALYAEELAKELGFYEGDPYGDLGRLQAELFRAVRLVVDTGIHGRRWTRDEAIAYMEFVTGMPHGDVVSEIERYIVMPGQACAYKIGQMKILEMRDRVRDALGDRFDLRAFHNVLLSNGAMPLTVMEQLIEDFIAAAPPPEVSGTE